MAFEAAAGAARGPHTAHAALAELAFDGVGADRPAGHARFAQQDRGLEKGVAVQRGQPSEQLFDVVCERRVLGAQGRQTLGAGKVVEVQDLVQEGTQAGPAGLVYRAHPCVIPVMT